MIGYIFEISIYHYIQVVVWFVGNKISFNF